MSEVRLERVHQAYGSGGRRVSALEDVSLTVPSGSFLSLLGASGAGKSTLLRILGGFEYPLSGRVFLGGEDITALPPHRRRLNTVFQDYALFPHMDVADNVAYGLKREGVKTAERRRRVGETLRMLQIEMLAGRKPAQLSGGQQQRVALARALVKRPPVLLLDEPLGALDRKLRQHVQLELKLLQRQLGSTFIFVTHDQEEALTLSDQIAVMRAGRIEQLGAPATLYDEPCNEFVAGFIGQQNFFACAPSGHGDFRCPSGLSLRSENASLPRADSYRAAIRPEHIVLSLPVNLPDTPGCNSLAVTVRAVVILGEATQYLLTSDAGDQLMVRVPRARSPMNLAEGARCRASWDARDLKLFPVAQ
jgi:spermidine/putrescine transport system ATP-binding protein